LALQLVAKTSRNNTKILNKEPATQSAISDVMVASNGTSSSQNKNMFKASNDPLINRQHGSVIQKKSVDVGY